MSTRNFLVTCLFLINLSFVSCSQDAVVGKWKLNSAALSKFDSMKKYLLADALENATNRVDSVAALKQLNTMAYFFKNASLELKNDGSFTMVNHGLIVKNSPNGWDEGGVMKGDWKKEKDKLSLIADNKEKFTIVFEIKELGNNSLVLEEIQYGTEKTGGQEIGLVKDN